MANPRTKLTVVSGNCVADTPDADQPVPYTLTPQGEIQARRGTLLAALADAIAYREGLFGDADQAGSYRELVRWLT